MIGTLLRREITLSKTIFTLYGVLIPFIAVTFAVCIFSTSQPVVTTGFAFGFIAMLVLTLYGGVLLLINYWRSLHGRTALDTRSLGIQMQQVFAFKVLWTALHWTLLAIATHIAGIFLMRIAFSDFLSGIKTLLMGGEGLPDQLAWPPQLLIILGLVLSYFLTAVKLVCAISVGANLNFVSTPVVSALITVFGVVVAQSILESVLELAIRPSSGNLISIMISLPIAICLFTIAWLQFQKEG